MAIAIQTLQFGWVCSDNVFSIEYEKQCMPQSRIELHDEREFKIKVAELHSNGAVTRIIAINAAQIYWTSASIDHLDSTPVVFFYLHYPPSFESEFISFDPAKIPSQSNSRRPKTTQRWSAFDEEQQPIAPYTSLAIRIICSSASELDAFRSLCDISHVRSYMSSYSVEHRGLFSEDIRIPYHLWVSNLEWSVAFQVDALAYSHLVNMRELLALRLDIKQMITELGWERTASFLRYFTSQAQATISFGDPSQKPRSSVQDIFANARREFLAGPLGYVQQQPSPDKFRCLHVTVTPTTMHLNGPFHERSNRVVRMYSANQDSFIRVSFVDETRLTYRFDRETDGQSFIDRKVKDSLVKGLTVAGRSFQFLAYSLSALKEHTVWFVKPFAGSKGQRIDAAAIVASLGSFRNLAFDSELIYCPARYAARISQAFTATDPTSVEAEDILVISDVKDSASQYCFTDGVGTISLELARAVHDGLASQKHEVDRKGTVPSLFQIRCMGAKGVVSVDYTLNGRVLCLRPSMIKFDAPSFRAMEIARVFDKPSKYYLNRYLIMMLEGLGVQHEVFQTLQDTAVHEVHGAVHSLSSSARFLGAYGLGASFRMTSTILRMHKLGLGPLSQDIFWQQMMGIAANHALRELKYHARIPVPGGWTLVGVADVHGYLNEGEVFVCIDSPNHAKPIYLEGPTVISRSPTIHPGDVQIAHAIGRPPQGSPFDKETLRNSVVFSIKGDRPLPSCLGGGDLDGDEYNVTTMLGLQPTRACVPSKYDPAIRKKIGHESTIEDVAEFVAEYICSDNLGIIASRWLIIADQSTEGILDPDCLLLAQLHSDAVDYPKSGSPVPLRKIPQLRCCAKPDWDAPEVSTSETSDYYKSQRSIGRLFRSIELPTMKISAKASSSQRYHTEDEYEFTPHNIIAQFRSGKPHYDSHVQLVEHRISELARLPEDVDEASISTMWKLFKYYASQLRTICADHTLSDSRSALLTEAEAVVGTIAAKCSQPRKRTNLMTRLREQTAALVNDVRAQIDNNGSIPAEKSLVCAWIAYKVGLIEDQCFGARSFAWIALDQIFDAMEEIKERDHRLTKGG